MWLDILGAGVDQNKVDGKANTYLLELWKQLQADQCFLQPKKKKEAKGKHGGVPQEAHPVCLADHLTMPTSQEEEGNILWQFE